MHAEEAAPADFNAKDADGRLRYPSFPPTIFVGMEHGNTLSRDAPPIIAWLRSNNVSSDIVEVGPALQARKKREMRARVWVDGEGVGSTDEAPLLLLYLP